MGEHDRSGRGAVAQAVGVVSALGRVVKERIGEFAAEADEEIREKLADAKKDLEDELADANESVRKEPAREED
jgi:F0F1-type ATP synthase membrane subunit b/b'